MQSKRVNYYAVMALIVALTTVGCTVTKQLRITSEPSGVRVSRGGGIVGTTPFNMLVPAGDALFCSSWYWSFYLEAETPYPGYPPIQKYIDPCHIPDNATVHFDFRAAQAPPRIVAAPEKPKKAGTGFIIDNSGLILTAFHVVDQATNIQARFSDGTWENLSLKSFAQANDIALLSSSHPLKGALRIAPQNSTRVGDEVYTLGFPVVGVLGDEEKYSNGTISSLSGLRGDHSLFQISVPVQPGNSGGPLCNRQGEVIGLITSTAAIESFYGQTGVLPQNINWAIKIEYALPLLGPTITRESASSTSKSPLDNVRKGICLIIAN